MTPIDIPARFALTTDQRVDRPPLTEAEVDSAILEQRTDADDTGTTSITAEERPWVDTQPDVRAYQPGVIAEMEPWDADVPTGFGRDLLLAARDGVVIAVIAALLIVGVRYCNDPQQPQQPKQRTLRIVT